MGVKEGVACRGGYLVPFDNTFSYIMSYLAHNVERSKNKVKLLLTFILTPNFIPHP